MSEIRHPTKFVIEPEKVRSLELSIEEVRHAKDELIKMSNNKEQRALYEMRAKTLKDKVSALNKARREGRREGIYEIVTNLKGVGVDYQIIKQTTGLSIEEIKTL